MREKCRLASYHREFGLFSFVSPEVPQAVNFDSVEKEELFSYFIAYVFVTQDT